MKKNRYLLAFSLLLVMAGQLVAQIRLEEPEDRIPVTISTNQKHTNAFGKKEVQSGWLSPNQVLVDYGATLSNSYFPLFQDSSVVIVPSSTATNQMPFSNSWNLFGNIFQPNDPLYALQTDGWAFSRFTKYTCDSVAFPFSYIRPVNQIDVGGNMVDVVDTVIVHFYKTTNLAGWGFGTSSAEIFALPITTNYSPKLLGPKDIIFSDTILLTAEAATDTILGSSINLRTFAIAIGDNAKSIAADNMNQRVNRVGFSIAFKTMVPYKFGDTLFSYNEAIVPAKKMNVFGTGAGYNTGSRVPMEEVYNNSFVTNRQLRYGQTVGNFKGYFPTLKSTGWTTDFYFNGSYHVTGANVGVSEVANKLGMKVYPNPALRGETIVVEAINKSAKVSISMIDVVGNVVYASANQNAADSYKISTSSFVPGIYFVSLTADGVTATQKVVITE